MKSIPPGFCEAADNAVIPGRPWWRSVNGGFTRRDGKFDVWPGVPVWMGADTEAEFRANPRNVFVEPTAVLVAVERIDAAHPLPHPGYRAGQVWLVAFGASWDTITVLQARNQHLTGLSFHSACVFVPAGAFLLHDPLMPSKAPWGPS